MSNIQLHNGECLEIMKTLPDNSVDMVMCDLPYGTTQNKWDIIIPLDELWKEYNRVCKENAAMVFTAQVPFDKVLGASNIRNLRYEWIWHKNKATGHLNAKKMPMKAHENVMVFYRKLPTYNPQKTTGHAKGNASGSKDKVGKSRGENIGGNYGKFDEIVMPGGQTDRYPRSILDIPVMNNDNPNKFHPTQKPTELLRYMIRTYSNPGDVVLDNTMGSGSTGVAAKIEGRDFIGIEMDTEYFNKASAWINEAEHTEWEYKPTGTYGYLKK